MAHLYLLLGDAGRAALATANIDITRVVAAQLALEETTQVRFMTPKKILIVAGELSR